MPFSCILPYQYVAIRVTNDFIYIEQLKPNTLINLGKYGSFHSNQIFGRPFYLTFEILDRSDQTDDKELRIVSPAEIHATALLEEAEDVETPAELDESGIKTNMNINDDPTNQRLTMAEIEALKQDDMGSTKELIAKIMQSHSTLDQKTAFSLAKYALRKHKKYMKRFTVLPLDVSTLTDWFMVQRDFSKVMEVRNETMGLLGCWGNIHNGGNISLEPCGRYLVVDDTGGLIVAAMAERMGILHQDTVSNAQPSDEDEGESNEACFTKNKSHKNNRHMSATSNSLTVIHSNQQPNLSILRYFNFDASNPTPSHPLYSRLRTLSWLQLLDPASDSAYQEPEAIPQGELSSLKSNRRSNYFRKRRRWERVKAVVDETRAGGFDGLIVAGYTNPTSILRHTVPLLAGGAQVAVYSPHVEPLVELADAYSTARRTAFLNASEEERLQMSADFPVDPTLLLVPTIQTSRMRKWQVLPGRTHPVMTSRGGSEGYVLVATRVIPAEGKVAARGRPGRRKKSVQDTVSATENGDEVMEGAAECREVYDHETRQHLAEDDQGEHGVERALDEEAKQNWTRKRKREDGEEPKAGGG